MKLNMLMTAVAIGLGVLMFSGAGDAAPVSGTPAITAVDHAAIQAAQRHWHWVCHRHHGHKVCHKQYV